MSAYLDTRGNTNLAIAVCDRCSLKIALVDLKADRNAPGLRVCDACNDEFDPWRRPARRTEDALAPHARPDTPLTD